MIRGLVSFVPLLLLLSNAAFAADAYSFLKKPGEWFQTQEALRIGSNVLTWQAPGKTGWPKNGDTVSTACTNTANLRGTYDNGATTGEIRLLAKLYNASQLPAFRAAVLEQFSSILEAQYPNGGWPQSKVAGNGYGRYVTFNDNSFLRLAELVRDVTRSPDFAFVPTELRSRAEAAFERAIGCVLRAQIVTGNERTVWCAQHDEKTLEPRPARTFELVSLSGAESAGLLLLLMSLEKPSPEVRQAVEAGVRWFEKAEIKGARQVRENGDKRMVADASAPPLWARFYEIGTNRPIFSGRDGVKRYSIAEIEAERRNGYAWYGNWGTAVLERYKAWKRD